MTQQSTDALTAQDLAASIRKLANGRTTLDVAQFQFVGFADIRQRYGAGWAAKRDRVQTIARHFIAKRIRMDDLMIPGADGFLLVYAQKSGKDAEAAAQRIGRELNEFFVGSGGEDAHMRIEAQYRSMNVAELTETMAAGNGEGPAEAVSAAAEAPISGVIPADRVRYMFQPKWDSKREAIIQYVVTPIDPRTQSCVLGYHYETGPQTQRSYAEIDERQLKVSEDGLRNLFASGAKALVGVQIHLSSLKNSMAFSRLSAVMSGFDPELKRYRVIRITGIEAGFPRAYLGDVVRQLKMHAPNISLGFSLADPDPVTALKFSPSAIGFPLNPLMSESEIRPEHFMRMRALADAAGAQNTPVFVDGGLSPELARRLMSIGVSQFSSSHIWPQTDAPLGAQRWLASRLALAVPSAA